jgi:hypothetical protein
MQSCCVSSESLMHSPPTDRLAHNAIVPYTRVCFLRVTASFLFPLIKGPTTQPASFFFLYVAPFTPLPSSHSIQQWLPRAGMNTVLVLSCGINNQKISKPISHWKARVTSDQYVMLEATH